MEQLHFLSKFVSPEIFYKCELEVFAPIWPMVSWSDTFSTPDLCGIYTTFIMTSMQFSTAFTFT